MKTYRHAPPLLLAILLWTIVAAAEEITQAEYFWDTDPGFGNGTAVTITPAEFIQLNFTIQQPLTYGFHNLFIRVKQNSVWGLTAKLPIWNEITGVVRPNLARFEYYWDTDPGVGYGTQIPISGSDTITQNVLIPVNSLSGGFHTLYLRVIDSYGGFSLTAKRPVWVQSFEYDASAITQTEYFFDTDPGYGNGTPVPSFSSADSIHQSFVADMSNLGGGFHTLFLRVRDAANNWSIAGRTSVWTENYAVGIPNLTGAEYFFDSDPGFGNGNSIPITTADTVYVNFTSLLSDLPLGYHKMGIRTRDANGLWSLPNMRQVLVYGPPDAPQFLMVSYSNGNSNLTWTLPTASVAGFNIYRHNSGYFTPPLQGTLVGTVGGTVNTFTDFNVNSEYYYRITTFTNDP